MADGEEWETTDVVICGCGPTGAMLSAYLGQMSISNVVLEKELDITTDPRGIALDEDGIRLLQGIGIYQPIFNEIGTCMQTFQFIGGTDPVLNKKPFLEMDFATVEGGTGHVGFICHKQPALEKHLRKAMDSSEFCELRSGCSVVELSEDMEWTYCRYRDCHGDVRQIRSRFFAGADGKTGYTRKQYLEPLGVKMEQAHDAFYDETWVALNWEVILPTENTHPNFPLWSLGYTPKQVYDNFFPENFRFLCNPKRAAVCGRFGLPSDRLWRFEFLVLQGEDGEKMAKPDMIEKVVFPYITHPGSRYGLEQNVQFPEDCIRVLRSRPFRFAARVCNEWTRGRVVLCGDSAHVFPPFGGQGIASGFRDAGSLAWRLALLCRDGPKGHLSHEGVLKAWYLERKQQLERSLRSTIQNGRFVTETNPFLIFVRNVCLWALQLIPACRHQLRLGPRREGMVRYKYSSGMPFIPGLDGGLCLPQVYCKAIDQQHGSVCLTDDVIFRRNKAGQFQLLVYLQGLDELPSAQSAISDIEDNSDGEIRHAEVTFIVEYVPPDLGKTAGLNGSSLFTLATADEFSQSSLCSGRPEPRFYDPYRLGKELKGKTFVIVRPDRFIFAACDNKKDLKWAAVSAASYIQGRDICQDIKQ